jgi:hypothetical protein
LEAVQGGEWLQENLDFKFELCNIFRQNAPLAKDVEDLRISKNLNKQDHIVIMGEAGNSMDINQYYSVDKDLNFIAERTSNTNVEFVNLLRRYDKLWMNGRIRSVNLQLDRALMEGVMTHINVIDTGTIVREEDSTHGLYLNSGGKMRLMHFTAESIHGEHVPSRNSNIPVITHARTSPFLG